MEFASFGWYVSQVRCATCDQLAKHFTATNTLNVVQLAWSDSCQILIGFGMEIESGREANESDRLVRARQLLNQAIEILIQNGKLIAAAQAQNAYDSCTVDEASD